MVEHTQTVCRQFADEFFLSVFDHFLGLLFKTLSKCQVLIKLKGAHVGGVQLEIAKNCFSKRRKR